MSSRCANPITRRRTTRVVATGIVAVVACTSWKGPASTTQEDMVAVSRMLVTLDRLAADGDVEGFLQYVSDDAVFMPPDEAAIIGKTQIGAWYRALYEGSNLEMSHEPLETDVFGRIIIHRGNSTGMLEPKNGAAPMAFDNKYLFVIRKEADGSLKIWRAIYNANPPEVG
jgi:ketosteroid isomerase-like protein